MKTVKPVDKATLERIGAAYAICSQYPDVFGDVTFRKFCGMFVDDIIDEGEDLIEARKRAAAPDMYRLLNAAFMAMTDAKVDEPLRLEIDECLCHITGDACPTDTDLDEDVREDEHAARKKAYAGEMYDFLDAIAEDMSERGGYEEYVSKIAALLDRIDGKEDADDE